jgi:hypothetical protein
MRDAGAAKMSAQEGRYRPDRQTPRQSFRREPPGVLATGARRERIGAKPSLTAAAARALTAPAPYRTHPETRQSADRRTHSVAVS